MRQVLCILSLFLSLGLAWTPNRATAADDTGKIRVLLILGSPPFHDIRAFAPILEKALDRAGGLEVTRLEPPADRKPNDAEHLSKLTAIKPGEYDVLVFYTTGYKLDELQERALEKFVESGGGIVALHGASATFGNSKVWNRLIGGRFAGHIPGTHSLNVVITDDRHPVTAGVGPFTIVDEEYKHKLADVDRHVLARFRERPPASDQSANMDIVWTREIGKGRVVYTALGHGKEAWTNPAWQKLTIQAIRWAAGKPKEVQIPGK